MKANTLLGSLHFRPRWWGALLAAAGCAAGILLGNWQAGRAEQKRLAALDVKHVTVRGYFQPRYTVFLDNKTHKGQLGYHVIQPLRIAAGRHVLVNRGWIPAGPRRDLLPHVVTPPGEVTIEGVRIARFPRVLQPGPRAPGRLWQNLAFDEFSDWSGIAVQDYAVEQHSPLDDKLVRDWPSPGDGADRNRSYALQWYSLAALSVVLFVVLSFRRRAPAPG